MDMDALSKKTTILLSPRLHDRLVRLGEQRGTSLGELVRDACRRQYGLASEDERLGALRALFELSLPTPEPSRQKRP